MINGLYRGVKGFHYHSVFQKTVKLISGLSEQLHCMYTEADVTDKCLSLVVLFKLGDI